MNKQISHDRTAPLGVNRTIEGNRKMNMMASPSPAPAAQATPTAMHDARDLMGGNTTTSINLDGQIYTLRITRQGKLILTK
jgi:hemin uptake protein HemP